MYCCACCLFDLACLLLSSFLLHLSNMCIYFCILCRLESSRRVSYLQDNTPAEEDVVPHSIHTAPLIPTSHYTYHTTPLITTSLHTHSTPIPRSLSPTGDSESSAHIHLDQNDWPNGGIEIERHASPIQPDYSALAALEQQLTAENEAKKQLQDELNSLRENQSLALEETRNEVSRAYQAQVASLQQSLMQSEHSLQVLERQLAEARNGHSSEVETTVRQQEAIRESALQERDQKHAAHILRLTAELSAQQEFTDSGSRDLDEQEAERIQMIKQGMKDMHEREKAQMVKEHEAEKSRLADDFRKQMEDHTRQMEQVANTKIQELHAQFMSAHQGMLEQKNAAESQTEQWMARLQQVSTQLESLAEEKRSVEEQYRTLLDSHSVEVEEMRTNARNLEEWMNTWKEKAAGLESRLELTGKVQESSVQQEQYEARLKSVEKQYTERLASLELVVAQQREENASLQEQMQRAVEEAQLLHQEDMDELRSQHGSEVKLMEQSITEASCDKGSLEAAEEHMSSLQKQLKGYRMQESDMNSKTTKLQEEQAVVVELLKERYEREKREELETVRTQFTSQVEALQTEISTLRGSLETAQSGAQISETESLRQMQSKHERELLEAQTALHESHEQALAHLRSGLEDAHSKRIEALKQRQEHELEQLRSILEREWSAKLEAARVDVRSEMEEARDVEIEELQIKHSKAMKQLQLSLAEQEGAALSEANSRIVSLESELSNLRSEETEWLELRKDIMSQLELSQREIDEGRARLAHASATETQLREQCQRNESRIQSIEADCDIAQSARAQMQQSLEHTQAQVEEWKAKAEELRGEIGDFEAVEAASREQAQKLLQVTSQLAERNVMIADLRSQNDTFSTEVFTLTQKCQQQSSSIQMLQRQLENAGAVSEEITALQQQLSELAPIKEHHAQLQQQLTQYQVAIQSKDGEIGALRSQLEGHAQLQEQLTQYGVAIQSKDGEIGALRSQLEGHAQLQEQVTRLETVIQSKDGEIGALRSQLDDHAQLQEQLTRLETVIQSKDGEIGALRSQLEGHAQLQEQVTRLETVIQSKDGEIGSLRAEFEYFAQVKEQVTQLEFAVQSKDGEIGSLRRDLERASVQMREMKAQWTAKLDEVATNSAGEVEALKTEISSYGAQENELRHQIQQQMTSLAQAESTQQAQQEELASAKEELNRLQGLLQEAVSSNEQLREANGKLSEELRSSREQASSEWVAQGDSLAELEGKYKELELSFAALASEKGRLAAELARVQEEGEGKVEEGGISWEVKVQQLETTVGDLCGRLSAKELAFTEMQSELSRKLAEAEMREQSLRQSLNSSQRMQEEIGLVTGQKSALEESLSRARRKLIEKLHEKESLEKDLGFHRTELERRMGEKQRLEELLFEKARFEQELMSQKEQLRSDLEQIESKLQLQTGRVDESGQQHQEHRLASVVTGHNQQVSSLRQTHTGELSSSLQSKHRKQVN